MIEREKWELGGAWFTLAAGLAAIVMAAVTGHDYWFGVAVGALAYSKASAVAARQEASDDRR